MGGLFYGSGSGTITWACVGEELKFENGALEYFPQVVKEYVASSPNGNTFVFTKVRPDGSGEQAACTFKSGKQKNHAVCAEVDDASVLELTLSRNKKTLHFIDYETATIDGFFGYPHAYNFACTRVSK